MGPPWIANNVHSLQPQCHSHSVIFSFLDLAKLTVMMMVAMMMMVVMVAKLTVMMMVQGLQAGVHCIRWFLIQPRLGPDRSSAISGSSIRQK